MKKRDFKEVKARYTIHEAWRDLGLEGEPGKSCRSPLREDRNASFSITADGMRFKDFGSGEAGDVGDFVALARGWSVKDALEWCAERAGINHECDYERPRRPEFKKPFTPVRKALTLPADACPGGPEEWGRVARLRRLDPAAVAMAAGMGVLVFGTVCGTPCWILSEREKIAEARRMDGLPFVSTDRLGERKAHTLAGSRKDWPLGLGELERVPEATALVVEGGPDYLAALHFLERAGDRHCVPVAMMGRSSRISPEALRVFEGRRVRLYPHDDPDGGGVTAALRWAEQITDAGGQGDLFSFDGLVRRDGRPVKDLN
ncbi:MAG: hypothetical protein JWO82_3671, partial [Akkermansiaceae bacterium]|nr:hypothetical protein [Akkermansiaceae bacterium]